MPRLMELLLLQQLGMNLSRTFIHIVNGRYHCEFTLMDHLRIT